MTKRSIEELNALDAAKIEKRRRMLARSRDRSIGDLEGLATQIADRSKALKLTDEDCACLVMAAGILAIEAEKRIDAAAPKVGGV